MTGDAAKPLSIGVIGAGTMGAGIVRAAVEAGLRAVIVDLDEQALERAVAKADGVVASQDLEALGDCDVVVEAVPEQLPLKVDVLRSAALLAPEAVLATNTSSLPVAVLAAELEDPERFVGMHFFNPAHRMRLLELVTGPATSAATIARARDVGEAMGKQVIVAADSPGFLVNRCARPFYLEACRVVEEGVATCEQVDRICREAGGYPMGPFELMDLIGIDISLDVSRSMWEQSYYEPRWRPSRLQIGAVAAGRLGRKVGGGFYEWPREQHRHPGPEQAGASPRYPAAAAPSVAILGGDALATALRERAAEAGLQTVRGSAADTVILTERALMPTDIDPSRIAVSCADGSAGGLSGFGLLPPLGAVVEVTDEHHAPAFEAMGLSPVVVGDRPGLVLGAIVAQLVNEAAFALVEGIGSIADIDLAATVGLNHPRGPFEWCDAVGADRIAAALHGLWAECHDDRYRVAPMMRRS